MKALQNLKSYLSSSRILSQPKKTEKLFLDPGVIDLVVSDVMVRKEHKVQRPVYYTNKIFHNVEIRYLKIKKVVLVLVVMIHFDSLFSNIFLKLQKYLFNEIQSIYDYFIIFGTFIYFILKKKYYLLINLKGNAIHYRKKSFRWSLKHHFT